MSDKRKRSAKLRRAFRPTSGWASGPKPDKSQSLKSGRAWSLKPEAWSRKSGSRSQLALFLAAVFLLKLAVVLQLKDHVLTQPDAGLDTTAYVALAQRVLDGDLALGPGLYFLSPLYIYFMAAVLAIGNSFAAVRLVQIALGTGAVALVYV